VDSAISIQHLSKHYKQFQALDDVSFEIQPGEFFGFLGPNGAGKTTTISVVTGLANYSAGSVKVFGFDVMSGYRDSRRLIGLVPQEFNFDPFLSAEQILTFEGGYFGMRAAEAKARAKELLTRFDIWDKRSGGYKKMSGGMKRRLLIARALMHRPKILILDEPTAGVDLELRYHLWDFLRELNRQGTTIFLTTHYIEEAERLCSRIGVIHKGKIVACEPTVNLIRKMSGDQVELTLKQSIRETPPRLEGIPVRLFDDGKKILFEDQKNLVPEVLRRLHESGIDIEKIDIRKPTLEDAFLKLTGSRQEAAT